MVSMTSVLKHSTSLLIVKNSRIGISMAVPILCQTLIIILKIFWKSGLLQEGATSINRTINTAIYSNILGLGGGQYCPPNLWEAFKQKLFESVIYNFLTIPKYVYLYYILWLQTKKTCQLYPDRRGVLRGVSNLPVKIYYAYFGHIHIFSLSIIHILSC